MLLISRWNYKTYNCKNFWKPEGSVAVKPCWFPCWFGCTAAILRPFFVCKFILSHEAPSMHACVFSSMSSHCAVFLLSVRQFLLIHGVSSSFPLSLSPLESSSVTPGYAVLFKLQKREESRGGFGVETLFGFPRVSWNIASDLIFMVAWAIWVFDITFLLEVRVLVTNWQIHRLCHCRLNHTSLFFSLTQLDLANSCLEDVKRNEEKYSFSEDFPIVIYLRMKTTRSLTV